MRVVAESGAAFLATVEKDCRGITLYTTDKKAYDDPWWWNAGDGKYGHHCYNAQHILDELKSISLVTSKKYEKTTKEDKQIVLADELKKNVGHYCEMYDGSEGFIAKSCYADNVCIVHNSDGPSEGWPLRGSRRSEVVGLPKKFISKFTKGWHIGDDFQATQVKVTKILDKTYESEDTSKCAESTPKKTVLDLTVRELLEKLDEIIKC